MLYGIFDGRSSACLLVLFMLAPLAAATHGPFFPLLHSHLARPGQAPSRVARLRSLQAVRPPPSAIVAARERAQKVEMVKRLKRLSDELSREGEVVGRSAEKIKRSLGGAASEEEKLAMGIALHDALFSLVQLVAAANEDSFPPSHGRPVDEVARARPAAASASPVPSGRAAHAKRDQDFLPSDPQAVLRCTLSLLIRHIVPAVEALPHLPLVQQESVRSLFEGLGEEVGLLVDVVREGLGWRETVEGEEARAGQKWATQSASLLLRAAGNATPLVSSSSISSHDYEAQLAAYREEFGREEEEQFM